MYHHCMNYDAPIHSRIYTFMVSTLFLRNALSIPYQKKRKEKRIIEPRNIQNTLEPEVDYSTTSFHIFMYVIFHFRCVARSLPLSHKFSVCLHVVPFVFIHLFLFSSFSSFVLHCIVFGAVLHSSMYSIMLRNTPL